MLLWFSTSLLGLFVVSHQALALTFGFAPQAFPRDPVEFKNHQEQMAIGQVLESLVSSDQFGNVTPAVAARWKIQNDGKSIHFFLRENAVFSNGQAITADDVVTSLERHWKNPLSQSYPFLSNIIGIRALSANEVELQLSRPQVAIFKVLSRDHLGIMPKDWKFSKEADEPYLGSGPYRMVRHKDRWIYIRNEHYYLRLKGAIDHWVLEAAPEVAKNFETISSIPDYAPAMTLAEIESLKKNPNFEITKYQIIDRFSFVQLLAWYNPYSKAYEDRSIRHIKMGIIRSLFRLRAAHMGVPMAYGLIPNGVSGHLLEGVAFPELSRQEVDQAVKLHPSLRIIKVSIRPRLFDEVFSTEDVKKIENDFAVKIVPSDRNAGDERLSTNADVIIDRWAGGFNDPEGFVPIINDVAKISLEQYLGSLAPLYLQASTELNWTKRSELFRKLDHDLVQDECLVPGWRAQFFTLVNKSLLEADSHFRYTPRLLDVTKR
jgi:hypothetical protein